jgi:glycosyltransferase involved in cell wall biosynthesis
MASSISVIVPIYNTESYLERCLSSIVEQSLKDIDIWCIDDCSSDGSADIVRRMQRADSRINLLQHKTNRGLGAALNTGINASSAQFIASVDSDDFIDKDMLEHMLRVALTGDFNMVEAGFRCVDGNGNVLSTYRPESREINVQTQMKGLFQLGKHGVWAKLWHRSLFSDTGIEFPEKTYFEDMATTPRLIAGAKKIRILSDTYYNYTVGRGDSIMSRVSAKHVLDYMYCFDILRTFFFRDRNMFQCVGSYNKFVADNINYFKEIVEEAGLSRGEKEKYDRLLSMVEAASHETAIEDDGAQRDAPSAQGRSSGQDSSAPFSSFVKKIGSGKLRAWKTRASKRFKPDRHC